jgi:hypothetical protein
VLFPDISLMDDWFEVNLKQEVGDVQILPKDKSLGNNTASFAFC